MTTAGFKSHRELYPWRHGQQGDRPWEALSPAEQEMVRRGHYVPGMWSPLFEASQTRMTLEQEIEDLYPQSF